MSSRRTKSSIRQPLALNTLERIDHSLAVLNAEGRPVVVAKIKFVQVAV
jgi:hypothetical protein